MSASWLLFAAGNPLEAVTRYLNRAGSYREVLLFALFAVFIGAIWITLFLMERLRKSLPTAAWMKPSRSLFETLCRTHHLDAQEVVLLNAAAGECHLASPSFLFVQPEHLEALSVEPHPNAASYRTLRERLFGPLSS